MQTERGFSLVEFLIVVGLVAILTVGIVTLTLAQHPSELVSATRSFDASLAAARAIAATSGNGATIVVAPRTQISTQKKPFPGFTLTVYRGRPTAANAVSSTTVMPVVSDIAVKETTLGAPPFAIFLSSAGHASGLASYPSFDNSGKPVFSTIAQQPSCPNGSLTLTFTSGNATQTRTLPCHVLVVGTPQPLSTPTPAPAVLTPNALVFYWPSAPAQHFVATEWGYTRWFAANAYTCGSNVAAFPQSNPAPPYSSAYSPSDASATPQPPVNVPYAFANSASSMEDAPASFLLVPHNAGTCSLSISDAFSQTAMMNVLVMGSLAIAPTSLALTAGAPSQNVALSKIFDGTPLQGTIIASTCSGIANFAFASGNTPAQPGTTPATAALTVTPQHPGACSAQIGDQYSASGDPPATLNLVVLAAPTPSPPPAPTPTPCPVAGLTLLGADRSCDDLYQWPVNDYECAMFNCSLIPANKSIILYAGFYVPHGTIVTYDKQFHSVQFHDYTCYATLNSGVVPTVFAYFLSNLLYGTSQTLEAVTNPAGFGIAQLANAAPVPHDPADPWPYGISTCAGAPIPM